MIFKGENISVYRHDGDFHELEDFTLKRSVFMQREMATLEVGDWIVRNAKGQCKMLEESDLWQHVDQLIDEIKTEETETKMPTLFSREWWRWAKLGLMMRLTPTRADSIPRFLMRSGTTQHNHRKH